MSESLNCNSSVCEGKVAFESPKLARKAAKRGKKKREVYRCGACGRWHVGGMREHGLRLMQGRRIPAVSRVW
jgi:hypothetical protein